MARIKDRSQTVVLLGMLLAAAVLVGLVFLNLAPDPDEDFLKAAPRNPRVSLLLASGGTGAGKEQDLDQASPLHGAFLLMRPLDVVRLPRATRFDFPLGSEHGALTYDAQTFGQNHHLGDDLNGIGGEDSDLGDAVYAAGEGRVLYAGWAGDGWGNLVILGHRLPDGGAVQSVYAHLEKVYVALDEWTHRGDEIGTVGKGAGQYLAHLHFEIRKASTVNPAGGYSEKQLDRVPPSQFLFTHRGRSANLLNVAPRLRGEDAWEKVEVQMRP